MGSDSRLKPEGMIYRSLQVFLQLFIYLFFFLFFVAFVLLVPMMLIHKLLLTHTHNKTYRTLFSYFIHYKDGRLKQKEVIYRRLRFFTYSFIFQFFLSFYSLLHLHYLSVMLIHNLLLTHTSNVYLFIYLFSTLHA